MCHGHRCAFTLPCCRIRMRALSLGWSHAMRGASKPGGLGFHIPDEAGATAAAELAETLVLGAALGAKLGGGGGRVDDRRGDRGGRDEGNALLDWHRRALRHLLGMGRWGLSLLWGPAFRPTEAEEANHDDDDDDAAAR